MPTVEDLFDLNQGFILITGPRRSGKTYLVERLRLRWAEWGLHYGYLSLHRPLGLSPSSPVWLGSPIRRNVTSRLVGLQRVIVDEPPSDLTVEDVGHHIAEGHIVMATSSPSSWMIGHSNWFIQVEGPGSYSVHAGLPLPGQPLPPKISSQPSPTIWERLLRGLDGN